MFTIVATSKFLRSAPIELRVLCEIDFSHPAGTILFYDHGVVRPLKVRSGNVVLVAILRVRQTSWFWRSSTRQLSNAYCKDALIQQIPQQVTGLALTLTVSVDNQ